MDEGRPLYLQIVELVENAIIDGELHDGERAPSTNELAAFHRINPATAAKGLNQLVDDGVLHKRRGLGMFVVDGAAADLRGRRRAEFAERFVRPLLAEAAKLGIPVAEVRQMIEEEGAR